jgi:ribosomal protein S18 acetylase RimI-like enzyme
VERVFGVASVRQIIDLSERAHEPDVSKLLSLAVGIPTADRLRSIAQAYRDRSSWHLLGFEQSRELIGCIGIEIDPGGGAVIRQIAVSEAHRGLGNGRALIAELCDRFAIRSLTAEMDQDALGFYSSCGFALRSLGEKYPGAERFECVLVPADRRRR